MDDKIVSLSDFRKKKEISEMPEIEESTDKIVMERITAECDNPDDQTEYTIYKDQAAKMLFEFLHSDAQTWEGKGTGRKLCSWDYKDILARGIQQVMEMEMRQFEEEHKGLSDEEIEAKIKEEFKGLAEFFSQGKDEDDEGDD